MEACLISFVGWAIIQIARCRPVLIYRRASIIHIYKSRDSFTLVFCFGFQSKQRVTELALQETKNGQRR